MHGTDEIGEAHLAHHVSGQSRRLLQIAERAGGDLVLAEDELLRDATAHAHVKTREELFAGDAGLVLIRELRHHAERAPAGHDCRLVHGHGAGRAKRHDCVASLVVRRQFLGLLRQHRGFSLDAHDDAILGPLQAIVPNRGLPGNRRLHRRHVHQVEELGAAEPGGTARARLSTHTSGSTGLSDR